MDRTTNNDELVDLRALADAIGCLLEADVLRLLGISKHELLSARGVGRAPPGAMICGTLLFPKKQFAAWVVANCGNPPPKARRKKRIYPPLEVHEVAQP